MNHTISIKKQTILFFILVYFLYSFWKHTPQEAGSITPRLNGGQYRDKRDIVFLRNNILKQSNSGPIQPKLIHLINWNENNKTLGGWE